MQVFEGVFFYTLGILFFLFTFWRRLKEDYIGNQIFSLAFISILGFIAGYALSLFFLPEWRFWLSLIMGILALTLSASKFGMSFFEVIEAWVLSALTWFFLVNIYLLILDTNLASILNTVFLLILIVLYLYFDSHYKKFSWYASGKSGFSGMFILGVFFLLRSVVAIFAPGMVFFFVVYDPFISSIVAFMSFLTIINLSRI